MTKNETLSMGKYVLIDKTRFDSDKNDLTMTKNDLIVTKIELVTDHLDLKSLF